MNIDKMKKHGVVKDILRALIGLLLVFIVHIPRLIFLLLKVSYASVFNRDDTLTADPKEHLRRAKRLLKRNRNSEILYAALEIRFALERMVQREAIFSEKISNKKRKEYDPLKKWKSLERVDSDFALPHNIYWVNRETGQAMHWGEYRPLDPQKISDIKGKLGDLLHPKMGIPLGLSNGPWYIETKDFLSESCGYLEGMLKNNESYFTYAHLEQFHLVARSEN